MKKEKDISLMDFAEYLRKSGVSVIKSIVILVKVNEMYNILKTLLATSNWSRVLGGTGLSKFLLEPLQRLCFVKRTCFISLLRFLITFS